MIAPYHKLSAGGAAACQHAPTFVCVLAYIPGAVPACGPAFRSASQVKAKLLAALERSAAAAGGDLTAAAAGCEERCFCTSSSRRVP